MLLAGCKGNLNGDRELWGTDLIFGRSFQARPRGKNQRELLNFREKFRPFAPIILDKYFDEWFEFPQTGRHLLQYMLATVRVKEEQKSKIPSVVHVDSGETRFIQRSQSLAI